MIKPPKVSPSSVIKERKRPPTDKITKTLVERLNGKITFSWYHFDRKHIAFNLGGTRLEWYVDLIDALKEVSQRTRYQLQTEHHFRAHKHDWIKLKYKYDLPEDVWAQLDEDACWQFHLSKSTGVVHGFFIDSLLCIVWLDPHHNLYPDQKYGGAKFFDKPLNMYERILVEKEALEQRIIELEKDIKELIG